MSLTDLLTVLVTVVAIYGSGFYLLRFGHRISRWLHDRKPYRATHYRQ